jgi:hypothetical protein
MPRLIRCASLTTLTALAGLAAALALGPSLRAQQDTQNSQAGEKPVEGLVLNASETIDFITDEVT